MKYYSLTKINNTKADYNLIIGQRSNGKTYAVCKYLIQQYKKTGRKFAYIRRWADDIKGYRAEQLFMPLQAEIERIYGHGYSITYYRHKYYLTDPDGKKQFIMGYALSLSEASHTKSVAYTDIKYILFDEFIQMAGERTLADEKAKFENTLSTLIRDKQDVVIYMLANTVSKFSPYFIYFGIDINKVSQGSIITKEIPTDDDKGILRVSLEYCEYNPDIGIFGMNVSVTFEKPGYRISKRKIRQKKVPQKHRISKEETMKFMEENFNVNYVTEINE
mgnify:CR=1 FL=1